MNGSVVLYLSSSGDDFSISIIDDLGNFREANLQSDNIHPYLKKALECKTHQAALNFLKGMKGNENCKLYHHHNPKYPSHRHFGLIRGIAHQCPLKQMISFVELRIKEKNSPHGVFDKIGKIQNRSFHYLSMGTAIPFLGIIPGVARVMIGLSQIIVGLALSILFAIPAYVLHSENSQIIFHRSVNHLASGPLNMAIGALQGIPSLGTWMYFNT